jgi:hypothetical protein
VDLLELVASAGCTAHDALAGTQMEMITDSTMAIAMKTFRIEE